jgi:hypothetical protein
MKLTVGPLPPAVYWRRRAAVFGAVLVASVLLAYSCNGARASDAAGGRGGQPAAAAAGSPTPTASATETLLTPTLGTPPATDPSLTPAPTPEPVPTGSCTDAEMSLTPVPESTTVRQGVGITIRLKIKNISDRTCTRDVGATPQELYIQQGTTKMWSSDACDPLVGNVIRTFTPGLEIEMYVLWTGRVTNQGCANRPLAPIGTYQIYGRLGVKVSDPVPLQIVA